MLSLSALIDELDPKEVCKGLFYRYTENGYFGSDGSIVFQTKLRPLKRMSCPGCGQCYSIIDLLSDDIWDNKNAVEIPTKIKNNDIVELYVEVDGHDWETGYVDACHVAARVVKKD